MVRFPALRFTAQGIRNGTTCVWIPRDDGTARASGIPVPTERPRLPCQKFVAVLSYPEEKVLAVGVGKPWATRRRRVKELERALKKVHRLDPESVALTVRDQGGHIGARLPNSLRFRVPVVPDLVGACGRFPKHDGHAWCARKHELEREADVDGNVLPDGTPSVVHSIIERGCSIAIRRRHEVVAEQDLGRKMCQSCQHEQVKGVLAAEPATLPGTVGHSSRRLTVYMIEFWLDFVP